MSGSLYTCAISLPGATFCCLPSCAVQPSPRTLPCAGHSLAVLAFPPEQDYTCRSVSLASTELVYPGRHNRSNGVRREPVSIDRAAHSCTKLRLSHRSRQ